MQEYLLQRQQTRQKRGQIVTSIAVVSVVVMIVALEAWTVFPSCDSCSAHLLALALSMVHITIHTPRTSHHACAWGTPYLLVRGQQLDRTPRL